MPKKARVGGVCSNDGGMRKKCSHTGCTNFSLKIGGVCRQHGAKSQTCSEDGCSRIPRNCGWVRHGPTVKLCNFNGCTSNAQKGGVCRRHGSKPSKCNYEGCSNIAGYSGGVCRRHSAKAKKMITCSSSESNIKEEHNNLASARQSNIQASIVNSVGTTSRMKRNNYESNQNNAPALTTFSKRMKCLYKNSIEAPLPENLRNRNAGSVNPTTASIFPARIHHHQAASNGLAATQIMQFRQEPAVVTTRPFRAAGCLESVPAAPMLLTTITTANAMPSGGANRAVAMSQTAAYGGSVVRCWVPLPDLMHQGRNSRQKQVMAAQLDFQNKMKYAGMPRMQAIIMPRGTVGANMNSPLGYRQVVAGGLGHAERYMQPTRYHPPDTNALNGNFAQGRTAPQIDVNQIWSQHDATIQMQQMQQLRNANLTGVGVMKHEGC